MKKLLSLFIPSPSIVSGVDHILRQQLLWMLLLRIILYTLLLGITYALSELEFGIIILPNSVLILLLLLVYSLTILSALILTKLQGKLGRFGIIQCLLDTIFASALIYFTGISNSIFTSVYFFAIITGGLLLPRKGGLISAAASTLMFGAILFLEFKGIVPKYFNGFSFDQVNNLPELINLFAVKGLTFFLAALLSAMFGMRLTSTEEVLSNTIESFDKLSHLYKTIFDNISTGIVTTNDHNIITSANNAALVITGYSLGELIGKELSHIFANMDVNNIAPRQAADFLKRDGTKIRIGYTVTSLNPPSRDSDSRSQSSAKEEDSKLITLQDISEIEELERKMRQGEKMAAIGMMSAGIAHDFRNPLTAISGSAQVLSHEFSSNSGNSSKENIELTNIILRESNRLITTIADFLKFARPDTANRQWFSLLNCVEEVLQVCRADPSWPETSIIELEIDPKLDIWADERQFFTVMNHLVQNGIVFCPPGKELIRINAKERKLADNQEQLIITIEDNGSGIPEDMYEKVFEPFYTNRADGTGLGLAIVRQTLEGHKGNIQIDISELGGAKFTLTLPLF